MARLIIELHGGRLWLGGEARGGLFEIRLPAAEAAPAQHPGGRGRPLVLLIEDDADTREIVCEILGQSVQVLAAADGEEGLRLARDRLPDLIITDLFLPRLDGFGVIEELARDPRVAETPVMILSAAGSDPLKVRGLNLGAADYVAKPFSARELVARVERLLRMARQREALKELAQTDALTDLPNFRAFRLRLDEEFKRSRRYHVPLACAMIDLDHLKDINDRLGHATGNRALATFAQTLRQVLRETDFAGRYGGDEFVLLLPHTSEEEAAATAERIQRQLAGAYLGWGGERLPLCASVGVAACTGADDETAEGLWQAADAALYTAKMSGRNRVVRASSLVAKPAKASPA
jgi:diguanylate cyclase (GGDEF)-like protein